MGMKSANEREERLPWEPMGLEPLGKVSEVVRIGGGKLSLPFDDKGDDPRKPKGQEN